VVVIEDIELYYNVRFDVKNCVADLTSIMFFSLWDEIFLTGFKPVVPVVRNKGLTY
jgi:hypothetical protein